MHYMTAQYNGLGQASWPAQPPATWPALLGWTLSSEVNTHQGNKKIHIPSTEKYFIHFSWPTICLIIIKSHSPDLGWVQCVQVSMISLLVSSYSVRSFPSFLCQIPVPLSSWRLSSLETGARDRLCLRVSDSTLILTRVQVSVSSDLTRWPPQWRPWWLWQMPSRALTDWQRAPPRPMAPPTSEEWVYIWDMQQAWCS